MTAEKLLGNNIDGLREVINDDDLFFFYKGVVCEFAKEFAKLHVEAAAKEIQDRIFMGDDINGMFLADKNSILNVYTKDNIK
jgi:hypothetical protein